ncbi:tail fiber domain-containing protein [Agromyces sp. NPDC004153]
MSLDPRTPVDDIQRLAYELQSLRDRIDDLAANSGTAAYRSVDKLTALITDIQAQLDDYIANDAYNKAQVDALIEAPPGNVAIAGNLSVAGQVRMPNVPVTVLTTSYFATYASTSDGGRVGHVPSSRRYKRDEAAAELDPATILALQLVTFRYIAAVEELGDDADVELGLIAEDVAELGLDWLVYRDAEGQPAGIRYERLALALLPLVQDHERRLAALERAARQPIL